MPMSRATPSPKPPRKRHALPVALLALALATGCGRINSAAPGGGSRALNPQDAAPQKPGKAGEQPGGVPEAPSTPTGGGDLAEGGKMLEALRAKLATAKGFDSELRTYTEGHYKQGVKVEELRQSTTRYRMIWAKPTKLRVVVLDATNPILKDAALVTQDFSNIRVRLVGLLSVLPIHMTADEPKLTNNRCHGFRVNNPKAQLERLTAPGAVWKVLGDGNVTNIPVKQIMVENIKHNDAEIDQEIVALEPGSLNLRQLRMFAKGKRVADNVFLKFAWDPKIASDAFDM